MRTLFASLGNDISKVNRIIDILLIKNQLGFCFSSSFSYFCNIECSLSKEMNIDNIYLFMYRAWNPRSRKKGFISITPSLIYGFCSVYGQRVHEGIRK